MSDHFNINVKIVKVGATTKPRDEQKRIERERQPSLFDDSAAQE